MSLSALLSMQSKMRANNDMNEEFQSTKTEFFPFSPLFDAALDDDYLSVQSLLSKSYDINTKDRDGITALHLCAYFNCLTTCNTLCARRAFVNVKDNRSLTPLFYACQANNSEIVQTLVEHGADCEIQNNYWQTPLHICAQSRDASCALHIIPHVSNIDASDQHGLTALHYACIYGNAELVNLLIKHEASVNISDEKQNSPLHWAAQSGSRKSIELLLAARANPNRINSQGLTPLHLSLMHNHPECALVLLDATVDIDTPTHHGSLPIHFAAYIANMEIFDQIHHRSTPESWKKTDRFENTILHFAAATKSDDSNFLLKLIEKTDKSLINVQNMNGQTPLHIATLHKNSAIVEQFLAAGADGTLKDKDGNTPLHLSVNSNSPSSIITQLVRKNPNLLCEKNQSGVIPLHVALNTVDYEIIDCLMPRNGDHLIEPAQQSLLIPDAHQRQALHYAARSGLCSFILRYYPTLDRTVINQQDSFGLTPLHYSCLKWFGLDAVDGLLRLGADVNIRCSTYGATPLHYILIFSYSSDTIEQLLQAGGDVSIRTNHGQSCLSYGIMQNDIYLLQLLFNTVKLVHSDLLELIALACIHGKDNSLSFLLEKMDSSFDLNQTMSDGMTVLMLACAHGQYSCVNLLLYAKVQIEVVNPSTGMTSVHYAALNGQSDCILALLQELRANNKDLKSFVDLKDNKGKTALHYCLEHSSPNCIRILINYASADPNIPDQYLLTPLHYCALHNGEESLQELLDSNDIQTQVYDQNKRLPLHYAAASGNATILSALTDYEYENIADIDGFSPLHYAVLRGHETAVETVLKSNIGLRCFKTSRITPIHLACLRADLICLSKLLDAFDADSIRKIARLPTKTDQMTPLHLACMSKNGSECVKQLIVRGSVDVDIQDRFQRTPIMYAIINGIDPSTIEMLIARSKHIELVDHLKNNVLHYACISSNETIVEYLVRSYPSSTMIDDANHENQRPLDLARNSQLPPATIDLLFSLTGRL